MSNKKIIHKASIVFKIDPLPSISEMADAVANLGVDRRRLLVEEYLFSIGKKPKKKSQKKRERDQGNFDTAQAVSERKPTKSEINSFYDSWEWSRISYEVKLERGRRCECCGATPDHGARIVTDHIKPLRHFWHLRLDKGNLQVLCDDCNKGKGSRDFTDFRCIAA